MDSFEALIRENAELKRSLEERRTISRKEFYEGLRMNWLATMCIVTSVLTYHDWLFYLTSGTLVVLFCWTVWQSFFDSKES